MAAATSENIRKHVTACELTYLRSLEKTRFLFGLISNRQRADNNRVID